MSVKKLNNLMLLFCLLCFTTVAFAQRGGKSKSPELRTELRAYMQQNITPTLREVRLKLDKQLSSADKKQIEDLRAQLANLHAENKQMRSQFKKERTDKKAPLTDTQKAEFKAQHKKRKEIMLAANIIAEKYKPQLQRIKNSLADDQTKWESDIKEIFAKHGIAEAPESQQKRRKHFESRMPYHQLMRPAKFILWDGSIEKTEPKTTETEGVSVFPNPVSSTSNVAYTVSKKGNVTITLLNDKGTALRTLLNERKNVGKHTLETNLSILPNGIYYYKIEVDGNTKTVRFMKQ